MRKTCKYCGEEKPLQEFNGPWNVNGKQRWDNRCRLCRKAYNRLYYMKMAEAEKVKPHSKVCISCRRELLAKHFPAHRGRPDGLQSVCSPCRTEKQRLALFRKPRLTEAQLPAEKTCSKCKKTKPGTEFYRQHAQKDGLATACRACLYRKKNEARAQVDVSEPTVTKKWCPSCLEFLPADAFKGDKRTKSGLWVYCRGCEKDRRAALRGSRE